MNRVFTRTSIARDPLTTLGEHTPSFPKLEIDPAEIESFYYQTFEFTGDEIPQAVIDAYWNAKSYNVVIAASKGAVSLNLDTIFTRGGSYNLDAAGTLTEISTNPTDRADLLIGVTTGDAISFTGTQEEENEADEITEELTAFLEWKPIPHFDGTRWALPFRFQMIYENDGPTDNYGRILGHIDYDLDSNFQFLGESLRMQFTGTSFSCSLGITINERFTASDWD